MLINKVDSLFNQIALQTIKCITEDTAFDKYSKSVEILILEFAESNNLNIYSMVDLLPKEPEVWTAYLLKNIFDDENYSQLLKSNNIEEIIKCLAMAIYELLAAFEEKYIKIN